MWRKALAFFRRDVAIARSYRIVFGLEILEAFFGVATFYYLSRFVSNGELTHAFPVGSDYFAFALVGFAFFDYLTVSLSAFDSSITEAQQNGTLEAMLVTETPLTMILIASAAYPFVLLAIRTVIYLAWGVLLFHFPIHRAGSYFDQLSSAVQARQPGKVADRGSIQFAWRHDVSGVRASGVPAMDGAAASGHLRTRGNAAGVAGGRQFRPTLAGGAGAASFRRNSPAAFKSDIRLGPAPHQDHRHADPFVTCPAQSEVERKDSAKAEPELGS